MGKTVSLSDKTPVSASIDDNKIVASDELNHEFDILLPRSYRSYDGKNEVDFLNEKWIELYQENEEYYLGKANYDIVKGFDDCSGDSLKIICPQKKVLVFMDYQQLKFGKIESLRIKKRTIWPGEKMTLMFNSLKYDLYAEGKVVSESKRLDEDEKEEKYMVVENYKLYLTTGNTVRQLVVAADFSDADASVEVLFVGDIDGDGKLDFVFGSNRNYEEERVLLFLSSKAEKGEAVKKVSEIAVQFDC